MDKLVESIMPVPSAGPSESFKEKAKQMGLEMFHEEFPQALDNKIAKEEYLAENLVVMSLCGERGDWKYTGILLIFDDGIGLRGRVVHTHQTEDRWSYPIESAILEGNMVKIVYSQYYNDDCKRKTSCDVNLLSFYPTDNVWLKSSGALKEYKIED